MACAYARYALFDDVCDASLFQDHPDEWDVVEIWAVGPGVLDPQAEALAVLAVDGQAEALAALVPGALVAPVSLPVEGRQVPLDVRVEWEAEEGVAGGLKEPKGRMAQVAVHSPATVTREARRAEVSR